MNYEEISRINELKSNISSLSLKELDELTALLERTILSTESSKIENISSLLERISERRNSLNVVVQNEDTNIDTKPNNQAVTTENNIDSSQKEKYFHNLNQEYGIDESTLQNPDIVKRNFEILAKMPENNKFFEFETSSQKQSHKLKHKDKEFDDIYNILDSLKIQGDLQWFGRDKPNKATEIDIFLEQTRNQTELKLATTSANPITEEQFKKAYADEIRASILQITTADSATKATSSKDIYKNFKNLVTSLNKGHSIKINQDSLIGWQSSKQARIEQAVEILETKNNYKETLSGFKEKINNLDNKLKNKYGEKYTKCKDLIKNQGWVVAYGVASSMGPVAVGAVATIKFSHDTIRFIKDYQKEKEKNSELKFGTYAKQNWKRIAGMALTATTGAFGFSNVTGIAATAKSQAGLALGAYTITESAINAYKRTEGSKKEKWKAAGKVIAYGTAGFALGALTGKGVSNSIGYAQEIMHNHIPETATPEITDSTNIQPVQNIIAEPQSVNNESIGNQNNTNEIQKDEEIITSEQNAAINTEKIASTENIEQTEQQNNETADKDDLNTQETNENEKTNENIIDADIQANIKENSGVIILPDEGKIEYQLSDEPLFYGQLQYDTNVHEDQYYFYHNSNIPVDKDIQNALIDQIKTIENNSFEDYEYGKYYTADKEFLIGKATEDAQELTIHNIVYQQLQNVDRPLTNLENQFIQHHEQTMQKYGLEDMLSHNHNMQNQGNTTTEDATEISSKNHSDYENIESNNIKISTEDARSLAESAEVKRVNANFVGSEFEHLTLEQENETAVISYSLRANNNGNLTTDSHITILNNDTQDLTTKIENFEKYLESQGAIKSEHPLKFINDYQAEKYYSEPQDYTVHHYESEKGNIDINISSSEILITCYTNSADPSARTAEILAAWNNLEPNAKNTFTEIMETKIHDNSKSLITAAQIDEANSIIDNVKIETNTNNDPKIILEHENQTISITNHTQNINIKVNNEDIIQQAKDFENRMKDQGFSKFKPDNENSNENISNTYYIRGDEEIKVSVNKIDNSTTIYLSDTNSNTVSQAADIIATWNGYEEGCKQSFNHTLDKKIESLISHQNEHQENSQISTEIQTQSTDNNDKNQTKGGFNEKMQATVDKIRRGHYENKIEETPHQKTVGHQAILNVKHVSSKNLGD